MENRFEILSELDIAYLAGLFDGEGCIMIRPCKGKKYKRGIVYQGKLSIRMVEREALLYFRNKTKVGGFRTDVETDRLRPITTWELGPAAAEELLKILLPHLRVKKEQASMYLKYRDLLRGTNGLHMTDDRFKQVEYYHKELQWLKHKPVSMNYTGSLP
jgi:hypothetical protein